MKHAVTSFHDIYQRYSQDVYRFSFWLCGNADEAKDLTSEAFVRLWTSKSDIITDTVRAYLFTIARNLYLQQQRKRKRIVGLDAAFIDAAPGPEETAESKENLQRVLTAMQTLPEGERTALILKAYEHFSYQEIARVLGISATAAKVRVHRARVKLATIIFREEASIDENYQ